MARDSNNLPRPSGWRAPAMSSALAIALCAPAGAADIDVHVHAHDAVGPVFSTVGPLRDEARAGGSVIRIGPPGANDPSSVSDGRVERPRPRPGTEGSLPGGREGGLVVVRQDVRDLIEQVAGFYGFDAVMSRQVSGEVENARLPSDLDMFVERLSEDRNLVFYFRNRDLNVSEASENVSRVVGLGPSSTEELRTAIEAAGIDADRFPLQSIEASNSVLVSGPPSYVGLVEVIAESLVRTERTAPAVTVIRGNQIERAAPDLPAPAPVAAPAPAVAN